VTNADDNSARIWNVETGELAVPSIDHADQVSAARFAPDGARIATTSGLHAQIWDVGTGHPLSLPLAHPRFARTATFSPDGNSLVTAGRDEVLIWDVGVDAGSLDDWHRIVRDNSFPALGEALIRSAAATAVPAPAR